MSAPDPVTRGQVLRVLSVEDEPSFTALLHRVLEREGFAVTIERVASLSDLESALDRVPWDLVLSDHSMPGLGSGPALRAVQARGRDIPFLLVSGHIGEEAAVEAMRQGADDYVPKSNLDRLGVAVRRALRNATERAELRQRESDLLGLHEVAFAAGRSLDSERLAAFVTDRARQLLGLDEAILRWWEPREGVFRLVAASGKLGPQHPTMREEGLAGAAFERRATVAAEDPARWRDRPESETVRRASALATPLFVGERAVGILLVASSARRHFSPQEIRLVEVLAAEVAPALEAGRLYAEAQRAANYDQLTGLPNRASFLRRLAEQIAACGTQGDGFAVLYADIDRFREVNDAFGHDAGDAVLRELGRRIAATGPETLERVARLGADEFAFILPCGGGPSAGLAAAEAGLDFLREPFVLSGQPVHLSTSIGVVGFPQNGTEVEQLVQRAEAAMFAAKRSQRRYAAYSPDLEPQSHRKLALLGELRQALASDQLFVEYHPQVAFRSDVLVGAEALLRWAHPVRGLIAPTEFIPVAEETGFIHELTLWILERALRQQRAWRESGLDLRVSVNVSMRDLRDPGFLETVSSLLRASGVDPDAVTLEITEGTIMLETERTLDVLRGIRELRLHVAIDDFGTGYSSLAYLSRLPVSEIKIDKGFVMDMALPGPRAIVQAVIDLGRVFGLRVVAEGVKDRATWSELRSLGCEIAQGDHLSRPLPPDRFAKWELARRLASGPTARR